MNRINQNNIQKKLGKKIKKLKRSLKVKNNQNQKIPNQKTLKKRQKSH